MSTRTTIDSDELLIGGGWIEPRGSERIASGIGRELGPEGLAAYLQVQSIYEAPPDAAAA